MDSFIINPFILLVNAAIMIMIPVIKANTGIIFLFFNLYNSNDMLFFIQFTPVYLKYNIPPLNHNLLEHHPYIPLL